MPTEIAIDGTEFLINGRPTYEGVSWQGHRVEGLLMNARMIQAIYDDECPETRERWRYPDTGEWSPERNTDEFCAHLPEYRAHGLLACTVGLQGGSPGHAPDIYDNYVMSAFSPDGSFKEPYFDRLLRVLEAADQCDMVVIVNYYYWKQVQRFPDDAVLYDVAERVSEWLLKTGCRNVLVDVANESAHWWNRPVFEPENVHSFVEAVKGVSVAGRRLMVGASSGGGDALPFGRWLAAEDISMPHGNGCTPDQLTAKLRRLKGMDEYRERPRPIVINEDGIFTENMEAAVAEHCSWGFHCQGFGSGFNDGLMDWTVRGRESIYEELSGFQTPPINWGINTECKRAFFGRLKEITGGA